MTCDLSAFAAATEQAVRALTELGEVVAKARPRWLITEAGEWPDKFVLLNLYVRTGYDPEYFCGRGRVEL